MLWTSWKLLESDKRGYVNQVSAHTPGPWRVFTESFLDGGLLVDVVTTALMSNQQMLTVCEFNNGGDHQIDLANARLIAAAPDLLVAAKLAVANIGSIESLHALEDAISKAEGREP